jgi:carotenoid 1,2-hydratase
MGPERFEIIMNGPPGHLATDEERQTCRTRTFATLEKMGLTFSPVPDDTHLTTPADFDRAFPASDGSLYGRSPHGMMATFHRPGGADGGAGALPLRGRDASGGGDPHGLPLRQARGRGDLERPCFDIDVPPDGYAWWYVDGISDDGERAISIIGFIGSVFSPWYRWSGRKNPANHCCLNVVTYGRGGRWTMTDRGSDALGLSRDRIQIGPSAMVWDGDRLIIEIDEMSTPHAQRLTGRVVVTPSALTNVELPLTEDGAHIWRPFAPKSDIRVELNRPGWTWDGHGYFDANFGTRALEADFNYWTWGRFPLRDGAACFYDATRRDGTELSVAVGSPRMGRSGRWSNRRRRRLARPGWLVKRETRADTGYQPKQVKAMLDAPFYNRSAVRTRINGEETVGVHEALDLNRFRGPWLMPMLAVRVPRRPGWPGWF